MNASLSQVSLPTSQLGDVVVVSAVGPLRAARGRAGRGGQAAGGHDDRRAAPEDLHLGGGRVAAAGHALDGALDGGADRVANAEGLLGLLHLQRRRLLLLLDLFGLLGLRRRGLGGRHHLLRLRLLGRGRRHGVGLGGGRPRLSDLRLLQREREKLI